MTLDQKLLLYAQQFEDQHAPENITTTLREAADEIERLRAGGCARDQGTTQYCAEAAKLAAENEKLRAALRDCLSWHDYSNDMHKPIEVRAAYMRARAALEGK